MFYRIFLFPSEIYDVLRITEVIVVFGMYYIKLT